MTGSKHKQVKSVTALMVFILVAAELELLLVLIGFEHDIVANVVVGVVVVFMAIPGDDSHVTRVASPTQRIPSRGTRAAMKLGIMENQCRQKREPLLGKKTSNVRSLGGFWPNMYVSTYVETANGVRLRLCSRRIRLRPPEMNLNSSRLHCC